MIKTNAKVMKNAINSYEWSDMYTLDHAYKSYSIAKANAFDYCIDLMKTKNGWGLKIISANTFAFSVGFWFIHPETGAVCFAYITRDYDRYTDNADFFPDNLYIPSYISMMTN